MADLNTYLTRLLYSRLPQVSGGGGSASGVLTVSTTSAATIADTNETDLWTYSMPANTLSADGRGVRVVVWGTFAANANAKSVRNYFGGTNISVSIVGSTTSGVAWRAQYDVVRTGASAQTSVGFISSSTASVAIGTSTPAIDTTAAITIKLTGQNGTASANDVVFKGAIVELLN